MTTLRLWSRRSKDRLRQVLACAIGFALLVSTPAYALNAGFDGINDYSHWWYPNCSYGDRAGASYVTNLSNALQSKVGTSFKYTDYSANESHLRSDAVVNSVDFYAFSGHGLNWSLESIAHFYARSTGESWHGSDMENYDAVNARTNEVRLGHGKLKWAMFYCCSWLRNNGSTEKQRNILKTFEGATLVFGFASIMYLDSREGTMFGQLLTQGKTFRDAFYQAADKYQRQRTDGDSIARIVGYKSARFDSLNSYYSCRPQNQWYINAPYLYDVLDN